jgi:chemotaxis signal transduction protein
LSTTLSITSKASELRDAFDRACAQPFAAQVVEQAENLIAIGVSHGACAIRASEITGMAKSMKIVPLPSSIPELLGIAGVRGTLYAVYSLAAILGYAPEAEQPRWLALCGTEEAFALAFTDFEGYVRLPISQLYTAELKDAPHAYVKHVVRIAGVSRPVVSIPHIRETIQVSCSNIRNNRISKER